MFLSFERKRTKNLMILDLLCDETKQKIHLPLYSLNIYNYKV